jgi:hypothetical protein
MWYSIEKIVLLKFEIMRNKKGEGFEEIGKKI